MQKQPVVILTGPTAVGKTQLSLTLAKRIGGEIISADSMQVYHHMDIGSAKIKPAQMNGIPHYLIDVLEPHEAFDVVKFQMMAKESMEIIREKGKIPIITGGTGFYIQALLYDIQFDTQNPSEEYRQGLTMLAAEKGAAYLHQMLQAVDEPSAAAIPPENVKRVIRALEYYHLTGEKISEHNKRERAKESPYRYCYFVLNDVRDKLYAQIDKRVDHMLSAGLVEEVRHLQEMGCDRNMVSMQGLGYKEILAYLAGELTLPEAISQIKRDTRHFAKRQLTWFRRERDVIWINREEYDGEEEILFVMEEKLRERKIIH